MSTSVFSLLVKRRFGPFFFTQFLGAFNDNVFRQALILLIASGVVAGTEVNTLNNVALALFILPFFLFSALAGQLADKYDRAMLVRRIKLVEIFIMTFAAVGFFFNAVYPSAPCALARIRSRTPLEEGRITAKPTCP